MNSIKIYLLKKWQFFPSSHELETWRSIRKNYTVRVENYFFDCRQGAMDKVKEFLKIKLNFVSTKMTLEKVENFYDVVRPLYNVAKLFGYSPFKLPKDTSWASVQHQATPFDVLISFFCFAFYLFLLYTQFGVEKVYLQSSLVIDVAEDILLAYLTCASIISTSILLIFRKHVWTLINDIASIDNKVSGYTK